MNLTGQPPRRKATRFPNDPQRLARVRKELCVICREFGEYQFSATTAHHPIHGRCSQVKTPDAFALPICDGHHQANFDDSKIALHRNPQEWKDLYGLDRDYINKVRADLGEDAISDEILGEWF